jgi:hypothetical protein
MFRLEFDGGTIIMRLKDKVAIVTGGGVGIGKASPTELFPLARLLVERAIYRISSFQNIRSARLVLAHRRTRRFG